MTTKKGIKPCPVSKNTWAQLLSSEISYLWARRLAPLLGAIIAILIGTLANVAGDAIAVQCLTIFIVGAVVAVPSCFMVRCTNKKINARRKLLDDIIHGDFDTEDQIRAKYCEIRLM